MKLFMVAALSLVSAELDTRQSVFQGKNLRILPLGASITWGKGSSDGNGYRRSLRDLLVPAEVTYIGTQCSGNMQNGNNEGHRNYHIDQLEAMAAPDIDLQPNVVLVYAGTNDMLSPKTFDVAVENMQLLVRYLVSSLPDALIVVSKLFLDKRPQVAQRIDGFDSKLNVTQLGNIVIADMSNLLTATDLGPDGEHPNDTGYTKMAQKFFDVLEQAEKDGKIASPTPIQYTPMCNGPPFIATTSSSGPASQPAAVSITSLATSQESSSMTSPDASSQTPSASPSMSSSLLAMPTTSQLTTSVPTAQETSAIPGAAPTATQPSTNSASKLLANFNVNMLLLIFSIWFMLGLW